MKYFFLIVLISIALVFSTLTQPLIGQNSVKGQAEQVSTLEYPDSVTYPDDMGVLSLTSPIIGVTLGNSEMISVIIKNFGYSPQLMIPVYYTLDGAPLVNDFLPGPIMPGMTIPFTFSVLGDFSVYCTHTLVVCTALPWDGNTNNDCMTYTIQNIIPSMTDTLWPGSAPNWTGSTNGSAITQNSLINFSSGGLEAAWAKFDISALPNNILINSAKLVYYVNYEYGTPTLQINQITNDPLTVSPFDLYNQIATGTNYITTTNSIAVGWHALDLPSPALNDLSNQTNFDWFALGFYEDDTCAGCTVSIDGWSEPNVPYIVANYSVALSHDIGVISLNVDTSVFIAGPILPTAKIANLGTNSESFSVTMTGTGGYNSVKNVSLGAGGLMIVVFDTMFVPSGQVCLSVQSNLPGDMNINNNMINWCWNNVIPPTVSGVVSYENTVSTPIRDSTTVLLVPVAPSGWIRIDTVDANGNYSFENILPGLYYLMVITEKVWGGGNSTDALLVLKHFVGMQPLTGLKLAAADANSDGVVTSVDALMIVERFIWAISAFPGSDWVSEQPLVIIPATTFTPLDIKVLCRGDVNGSYTP
ncbi:MAG: dockerin type I repeat-containing protein [Bacteroidetes bacterium]|nr:dockerin type I repeat-containing protein [Bacteroidota bacterium]